MNRDMARDLIAPAYLFLCLVAGGSGQGIWLNALLQLLAVVILVAAAAAPRGHRALPVPARQLSLLAISAALLVLVQLVPLPPVIWTNLPGRWPAIETVELLAIAPGWRPLSLTPYETLSAGLAALPALAMLAAILRLSSRRWSWIALAIVAAALAGILLGVLQVGSGSDQRSPYYLYAITNVGVATGFFANANHMASLLLATMPFAAALGAAARDERTKGAATPVLVSLSVIAVAGIGLLLNGSLAGLALALPVGLASLVILAAPLRPKLRGAALAAGAVSLFLVAAMWFGGIGDWIGERGAATSVATRAEMSATSAEMLRSFWALGSGLGSYARTYPMFEAPGAVAATFVNHAHNDYLELLVELGIAGLVLILGFLWWWCRALTAVLRSAGFDRFAAAGAIASGSLLVHSLVDFPLRTAALSALFAACLAAMVLSRRSAARPDDLRPARHLVIG
jgi:O-antigen ligase